MKRRTIKRVTAAALSAAMMLTAVTGCGNGTGSSSGGSTSGSSGGSAHGGPYEDFITVDVFDSQSNFQGLQSGWFADVVKEKFNMELNIIAPNVAGGGDTLFQTRSANGNLGDIIITNLDQNRLKDLVTADLVLDMTDYLDGCDNLKNYSEAMDIASALAEQDGTWAVPSEVSTLSAADPCDAQEPTVAPSLRWDVYGQVGYPEMKDLDDLLDVLEQMQNAAGTSDSGQKVYALSLFKDWDGDVMQNSDGIKGLYGYQQLGFCMAKVDGSEIQSVIDDDGIYVRSLKFYFDANQRGLVDPESTTQNFDTLQSKYKDGSVLYSLWPWLGAGQYNTDEHTSAGKGFATATIDDMQCLEYGNMPYGKMATGIMVGSKAQDPQRMVDFIDWLYSPEGVMYTAGVSSTMCGPEGLTWEMKDGKPVLTEFGTDAFVNKVENLEVPSDWGSGTWKEGSSVLNYKSLGLVDCDPDTGICYNYLKWDDYAEKTATPLTTDWSEHNDGALNALDLLQKNGNLLVLPGTDYATPEYPSDIKTIKEQCKQVIVEYSWKMVFAADEAEFNSLLDEMQTTVEGLGYDQVLEIDKQNCQDEFAAFDKALGK